ncbi:hypothetical protein [Pendulispora albinea]|uniref:Uncharacterized protein n=1 Tax=Pendulispora albinea TaxID=2741071 RepID=A0ABZ2LT82_9BACT
MKEFRSFTMIREPVDTVWTTMRDRLSAVAATMDDLHGIEELERTLDPDGARLLNRWIASQKVPALLRDALGSETISWLDRARWHDAQRLCEWTIEPSLLHDHVACGGRTRYESAMAGRGTRVSFEGYFELRPGFGGVLSPALEPVLASFVESMVSTLIPRNLTRAIVAAGELIAADRKR